jgi:hypothetical protein
MSGIATGRDAVEFVWDGQEGLFELAFTPDRRMHYSKAQALESLEGNRYYAPLARKSPGSKKENVADTGNVLWADIDSLDGLDRLNRLPIRPSLVLFSGKKGYWAYLKLSRPIPSSEIELLNRRLAVLLEADGCHNRDRIARLPGSIHQDSGKRADVVEFPGALYDPSQLSFLPKLDLIAGVPAAATADGTTEVPAGFVAFPEFPVLGPEVWTYIERSPRRGEGYDRSKMEQKIFTALVYQGWTDEQIITFANVYRLPRHLLEWAKHKKYSWTERGLKKARVWADQHPSNTNTNNPIGLVMCIGSDSKGGYSHTDNHKALRLVTGAQTTKDLVHDLMTILPNHPSESTAYRLIRKLRDAKPEPYIRKNGQVWQKTAFGERQTATKMNYLMVLPRLTNGKAN